ncbi:MAG: hypothetical protein ACD_4C00229G0001, partial [uncultured bacterium (gcode 4)]
WNSLLWELLWEGGLLTKLSFWVQWNGIEKSLTWTTILTW